MKKRILVSLLAISMIFTAIPTMAAEEDIIEFFDGSEEIQGLEEQLNQTQEFQDDSETVFQDSTGEIEFQSDDYEEQFFSDEDTYMAQGGWTVTDLNGGTNGINHDQKSYVWTVSNDAIISGGNDIASADRGISIKEQDLLRDRIVIAEDAVITLDNAKVILPQNTAGPGLGAALTIKEGKNVTLKLKGANKICAGLNGQGILVEQGAALTIQEEEPGASLYVEAASDTAPSAGGGGLVVTKPGAYAGIGGPNSSGGALTYTGSINIVSGDVTAIGYGYGAAIGGGDYSTGGKITISGGRVTAKNATGSDDGWTLAQGYGSAIGGSEGCSSGIIRITGGEVLAEVNPSNDCPAIGGSSTDIEIHNATVTAYGGTGAAAIGGYQKSGTKNERMHITIGTGAVVTAYGGTGASAIGEGFDSVSAANQDLYIEDGVKIIAYSKGNSGNCKPAISAWTNKSAKPANLINVVNVASIPVNIPLTLSDASGQGNPASETLPADYQGMARTYPAGQYKTEAAIPNMTGGTDNMLVVPVDGLSQTLSSRAELTFVKTKPVEKDGDGNAVRLVRFSNELPAITGIPNGTTQTALEQLLPVEMDIETTAGIRKATLNWSYYAWGAKGSNPAYSTAKKSRQTFPAYANLNIPGTIISNVSTKERMIKCSMTVDGIVKELKIKENPVTSYYTGNYFNPSGLVVEIIYEDDEKKEVSFNTNAGEFVFSPPVSQALTLSDKSIDITVEGSTVQLPISVSTPWIPPATPSPLDGMPDGSILLTDGSIQTPNGTLIKPDGTIILPDKTGLLPAEDGSKPTIDKQETVTDVNGTVIDGKGNVTLPGAGDEPGKQGTTVSTGTEGERPKYNPEDKTVTTQEGSEVVQPGGNKVRPPKGSVVQPDGTITFPNGDVIKPDGSLYGADGSIIDIEGSVIRPATPVIENVKVLRNNAETILEGECAGAQGYDFVISENINCIVDKDYLQVNKNILLTKTTFRYVQKGTYYAYCHSWFRGSDGKKVFSQWSEPYEFTVTDYTPDTPSIVKLTNPKKGVVVVTVSVPKGAKGFDVILGRSTQKVNGEKRPVEYGKDVRKNCRSTLKTVTFKNVKPGIVHAALHSYSRSQDTNIKVFSRWSEYKSIKVK